MRCDKFTKIKNEENSIKIAIKLPKTTGVFLCQTFVKHPKYDIIIY